jgi:hypothetical protein
VDDGQRQRRLGEAVDDLAHQVGALVAEEQAGQHLDLEVGAQPEAPQLGQGGARHLLAVAFEVGELALQLEVADDAHPGLLQVVQARVVGAVGGQCGGFVVFDVFGADRGAHEDEIVAEVAAVQQLGRHAVEEGLGQLGLAVVDQKADVVQLGLLPSVHRQLVAVELPPQALHRFVHAQVVELDALRLRFLLAVPVGGLEAALGLLRGLAEQPVVAVETFHQRLRDRKRAAVGQLVREHQVPTLSRPTLSRPPLSTSSAWRCHQRRLTCTRALS